MFIKFYPKGMYIMQENDKCSVSDIALLIIAAVSFFAGLCAGAAFTKFVYDMKQRKKDKEFNAGEYIRSLNLDE